MRLIGRFLCVGDVVESCIIKRHLLSKFTTYKRSKEPTLRVPYLYTPDNDDNVAREGFASSHVACTNEAHSGMPRDRLEWPARL